MRKKVLLTGGGGFIGSHIAEGLISGNYSVKIIDNFSTGNKNNLKDLLKQIELVEGDIRDYSTVVKVMKEIDIVVHLAALPSVPRSINDPITTNEVNVNGTLNMLWAAVDSGVSKFIFASSSSVYGNSKEKIKHENICPSPLSPYAVSKLTGENYCKVFTRNYGLNTVCFRYFNVFGARQNPDSQYSAVIPKFISMMKKGISPVIYGDGTQSRDFTYVKNIVNANLLAIENTTQDNLIINCTCGRQTSVNDVVKEINNYLGKNIEPIYKNERAGDIKHSLADISLANEKINYVPEIYFDEGMKQTIEKFFI